ncbi:MAG: twin-arginine translocation signal domain-containing protein [Candidatus Hydrogenedentes bacterium]|nr:twin-arginine translocation signal domain-containing protein [Candidatus Hydrogenedentota bacterium]
MESRDKSTGTSRRNFLKNTGALGAGLYLGGLAKSAVAAGETLAINGGAKAVTHVAKDPTRWPIYGEEEIAQVSALLLNPSYTPVAEFEEAWQAFFDCPLVKAHFNGTSALTSMLFATDFPEGSEILVPDYSTWFPVVPMRFFGLVPVFVDVNPNTMNLDVEDCKKHLTAKTKAILPVHWFGLPCDMDDICAFADEHGLSVLEDASHAHGAKGNGKLVGNWGRMAGFSLQGSKPLPAIEGGMAMYKDRGDYERAVTYGNYDLPNSFPEDSPYRKYQGTAFGSKLRIHPVAAILGRLQLAQLVDRNTAGIAQMARLNERLSQLPGLSPQYVRPGIDRVYYSKNMFFIDEAKAGFSREKAIAALQAEGVDVTAFTWTLLHTYPVMSESKYWRHMPVLPDAVPGCDQANRQAIQLPYWTSDQPELVEQYAAAFEKVWANKNKLA